MTDDEIHKFVRVYMYLQKMFRRLYNPEDQQLLQSELGKYRKMHDEDLHTETTLIEVFMSGQHHKYSSWLWTFEDTLGSEAGEFIK